MDSSTSLGQETPTEGGDVPPASSFPESRNPMETSRHMKANNPPKASILPLASPYLFRSPKVGFPLEAHFLFRSALRSDGLAPFLLDRIRNFYANNIEGLPETGVVRHINQRVYNELNDLLIQDEELRKWASRQMKIVYVHERQKLSYDTLRDTHQGIIFGVYKLIQNQLDDIGERWNLPDVAGKHQKTLADQIRPRGCTSVRLVKPFGRIIPDMNWIFTGGHLDRSCFILEVANCHQYDYAKRKAFNMVSKSSGYPGMVLIIWVKYNEPDAKEVDKTAGFTLLGLRPVKQTDGSMELMVDVIENKRIIRDANGEAQHGFIVFTVKDMLGVSNENVYEKRKNSEDRTIALHTAGILEAKIELSYAAIAEAINCSEKTEADMRDDCNDPDRECNVYEGSKKFNAD